MRLSLAALGLALTLCTGARAAGDFSDWGAVVVAGDYHAHDGSEAEVFDNARRDMSARLQAMGFKKENVLQFSVRPERYAPPPLRSDTQTIANALWDLSNRTSAGCLIYMTSHGSPDGIQIGDGIFPPKAMANMVSNAC
ncbi:MAG TPA: hypothetical protein VHU87_14685, partial [Rhizomicrobium sp.]|nr:hypothetical protein [Rhizomicrobium sp.]